MAKLRFHIRYPEEHIPDPILYEIGKEFQGHSRVSDGRMFEKPPDGWMWNFTGEADEIERAIEGLRLKGCIVDPIELNVVE